jgi:hypothetical protein
MHVPDVIDFWTFGQASGLQINLQKSEIFSIAYNGIDLGTTLQDFLAVVKDFPCQYLGLPLHIS